MSTFLLDMPCLWMQKSIEFHLPHYENPKLSSCYVGTIQQLNINTHFVDASLVYGHSDEIAVTLRSFVDGKLLVGDFDLLPETKNEDGKSVEFSGDSRHRVVPSNFVKIICF